MEIMTFSAYRSHRWQPVVEELISKQRCEPFCRRINVRFAAVTGGTVFAS